MVKHITPAEICRNVPDNLREDTLELAENVEFMRKKLEETRKGLTKQQVVIAYDNGGGQRGIRENPAFKGYHSLLTSYRKSIETLAAILRESGESARDEDSPLARILAEAKTVLENA